MLYFPVIPSEIQLLVEGTKNTWKGMGLGNYKRSCRRKKIYHLEDHYTL